MHGGDLTRSTFDPVRRLSGVRMQQGRVQLDADWNEQLDIQSHRDRMAAGDTIGPAGAPKRGGGFLVAPAPGGTDLLLTPGRAWVGGTLCELGGSTTPARMDGATATVASLVLDGAELAVHDWVELEGAGDARALARVGAVDTAARALTLDAAAGELGEHVRLRRLASYTVQPDLPVPEHTTRTGPAAPPTLALPDGAYLAYLDVWQRTLTALEAPEIRETALGGPDTTTRSRNVWQLRLLRLDGAPPSLRCDSDLSAWTAALAAPTGTMAARAEIDPGRADLCTPTPAGGFTGLENQLYRVQVHDLDTDGRPLVVWSRDNGSVVTTWSATAGDQLTVGSIGRDAVLGFADEQWVELLDDARELDGRPGTLAQLAKAEGVTLTVARDAAGELIADGSIDHADFGGGHAKVRRWDSPGAVAVTPGTPLALEDGVQVTFAEGGTFRPGDYWLVPARTATADVEWPRDSTGRALQRPPDGVEHAYTHLALIRCAGGTVEVSDCRERFPSLTTLTAADVDLDDTACALPGADTVQDALDQLCQANDLRRHHRLLHGWGIVCGLEVHCGPDGDDSRRSVTVLPGTAIDAEGNDLDLGQPATLDLAAMVDELRETVPDVLDGQGNGEVCLSLRSDAEPQVGFAVSKFDPAEDEAPAVLAGTLLMDFYNHCIKRLHDWLREELTPAPGQESLPATPARQRLAALVNLAAQPVNPTSGRHVFLSPREDELLQRFYVGLRERLQSETFCAMFDNARTPPTYPTTLDGLDTIFGTGGHTRLRLRPGGNEAYTVGAGLSPFARTALINRYDLLKGLLVAQIDPIAGKELGREDTAGTGTAAATDVAFSPDGKLIYVAVPTYDEDNTIFRVGEIGAEGVSWRPMVTICGVKLVTLATTAADPGNVYAIGLRKVTTTVSGKPVTEWHGAGLYRINPANVDPDPANLLVHAFNAFGHLVITGSGVALATAAPEGQAVTAYTRLVQVRVPAGTTSGLPAIELGATGTDDLTVVTVDRELEFAYTVVDTEAGGKGVVGHQVGGGTPIGGGRPTQVQAGPGGVQLLGVDGLVAFACTEQYRLGLVTARDAKLVDDYLLPLQVGPVSMALIAKGKQAYVLNYASNTLSSIDRALLDPRAAAALQRFVAALEIYRKGMVEAGADLVAGFAQYLKDCFFDHFLVRCPQPTGEETLYLACVSIRDHSVYKVCNFSRRRYVKSFPTVGYWLSAVPVLALLKPWFAKIACMILPEYASRLSVQEDEQTADRVSVAQFQQLLGWTQSQDLPGQLREAGARATVVRDAALSAVARPQPQPVPPGGPRVVTSDIVDQPAERVAEALAERGIATRRATFQPGIGIAALRDVAALFRDAAPGDEVTLYEEDGSVRYFTVAKRAAPPAEARADLAERLGAVERELAELRAQLAGPRAEE
jgi:Family of unknown function (DUF6519)